MNAASGLLFEVPGDSWACFSLSRFVTIAASVVLPGRGELVDTQQRWLTASYQIRVCQIPQLTTALMPAHFCTDLQVHLATILQQPTLHMLTPDFVDEVVDLFFHSGFWMMSCFPLQACFAAVALIQARSQGRSGSEASTMLVLLLCLAFPPVVQVWGLGTADAADNNR
jgi:hypothetical protein